MDSRINLFECTPDYSFAEKKIATFDVNLANAVRATRLNKKDIQDAFFYSVFSTFVLPLNILICFFIKKTVDEEGIDSVCFLARDGYWFIMIFKLLFPKIKCTYKYFSRLLSSNDDLTSKFIAEINSMRGKKLIFDLHGNGTTICQKVLPKTNNTKYLLCFRGRQNADIDMNTNVINIFKNFKFSSKFAILDRRDVVEDIFAAPHGSTNSNGSIMAPEYDINFLKEYMTGFALFEENLRYYNFSIKNLTYEAIRNAIEKVLTNEKINLSAIERKKGYIKYHTNNQPKFPLRFYSSEGEDKFYIQNYARYICNGVFMDIGDSDNTYFLEKNLNWTGARIANVYSKSSRQNRKSLLYDFSADINMVLADFQEIDYMSVSIIPCIKSMTLRKGRASLKNTNKELRILKLVDFNKHKINYICVKRGAGISALLESKGYKLARRNETTDEFYNLKAFENQY